VRPDRDEVAPLALDNDFGLPQRVEDFTIEQFNAQACVEALFNHAPFLIGHVGLVSIRLANMLLSGDWGLHGNSGVGVSTPLEACRSKPLNPFRNGL
jgi:hypothetical protein